MKRLSNSILALTMAFIMIIGLVSCSQPTDTDLLWEDALYTSDTTLGEGSKTVTVEVKAGERSIVFTIKTDETNLGDVLVAHGLVEGEESEFGLYVKKVNGINADYDVDQSYWGFFKGGEYMMTGVSGTEFVDGDGYELVYTK